jgi:hypothetical protein
MEFAGLRLFLFLLLIGVDLGVAVYYRYINVSTQVGYVAHLGIDKTLIAGLNLKPSREFLYFL